MTLTRTIQRLLVANRGEIARRIQRTAHDMGISTVAVFADSDHNAPFVREADQAIALGGSTSAETYLVVDKILDAARRSGADAIHPGYGFLAENADFARAVDAAGLIWVGPSPESISAMGDKLSAKRLMDQAGVPTLPAAELTGADDETLVSKAREVGYPLLVKASAGGGGKGMRIVSDAAGLKDAVAGAKREAAASFGDDTVFLERWLERSRHVEIQLLGDLHGHLVHCFERECSIQRRHQKIIEEAPSPAVSDDVRDRMGEAAVAAGKALGYASAGTVEFLLQDDEFFFLEVNTRLQVEHPVTEEITGLDLVREQLRVAQGEPLGFGQDDLKIDGHAIEARLYAEDPANDFLPVTGKVHCWKPSNRPTARFDSGIESGSEVGIYFDPMLAKVIVHAPSRREAALRLARVLEETRVQGMVTNRDFLVEVLRSGAFLDGDTTTDFLERVEISPRRPAGANVIDAAVALALACQHDRRQNATQLRTIQSGWRNTPMPPQEVHLTCDGEPLIVRYQSQRDGSFRTAVTLGESEGHHRTPLEHRAQLLERTPSGARLEIDGRRVEATVTRGESPELECTSEPLAWFVHCGSFDCTLIEQPRFPLPSAGDVAGGLVAPMPGNVIDCAVEVGQNVEQGELLVVLEAMKMEHRIVAPGEGTVTEVRVAAGDQVENGALLVVVEPAENRELSPATRT